MTMIRHTNKIIKSVNKENAKNKQAEIPVNSHNNPENPKVAINPVALSPKSIQPKIKRDPESKVSLWLEDYLDLQSMRIKPVSELFIERLALEVMEWSKLEESIIFRDFIDNKNIPEDAYYRWVRTYPNLKAAHTLAKGRIGSRREKGAITRKFDGSTIIGSMSMYDQEWKDLAVWKSSLKDQSASSGNITINLPNITTSHEGVE